MAIDRIKVGKEAEALFRAGKKLEAIGKFNLLVKDNPKDLATLNRIGDIHLELGRNDDALEAYRKAGDMLGKDGFYAKAIAIYKKALRIDDKRPELHERMVQLFDQGGMSGQAKESLEYLTSFYQSKAELGKAAEYATRLVKIDPKNFKARLRLGDLQIRNKKIPEGVAEYLNVGRELTRDGAHAAEASKVFERILQMVPDNQPAFQGLIDSLLAQKLDDQALAAAQNAVTKHPVPAFRRVLADLLFDRGKRQEALAQYEQIAAAGPLDAAGAGRHLLLAIQLKGEAGSYVILKALVEPLMRKNAPEDAEKLISVYLDEHPHNLPALELSLQAAEMAHNDARVVQRLQTLEQAYAANGMPDQARQALAHLLEIEPYNDAARARLVAMDGGAPAAAQPAAAEEALESSDELSAEEIEALEAAETLEAGAELEEFETEVQVEEDLVVEDELEIESPVEEPALPPPQRAPEPKPAARPTAAPESQPEPARAPTPAPKDDKTYAKDKTMEAEVFIKYGLLDKALDQYRQILKRLPDHLDTRQRMKQLYLEQGARDKALQQIIAMAETLVARGDNAGAAEILDEGLAINPAHPKITELSGKLGGHPASSRTTQAPFSAPPPPPPPVFEAETPAEMEIMEVETTAMVDEPALDIEAVPEPEPPPPPPPRPPAMTAPAAPPEPAQAGGGMLDLGDLMPDTGPAPAEKTEDFIDLAADLNAALDGIAGGDEGDIFGAAKKPPEEMSFDEVLSDFKKGVAEQVDAEDYSTHYNLGIAYKEMGLHADACGEFQYCMRSPQYFLEAVSMLGVCLREQGKFEEALKWYSDAMDRSELNSEQKVALRYEQADTMEAAGDKPGALALFEQIQAQADGYRGVSERVDALRGELGR